MPRKRTRITPNQVVAFNLRRIREGENGDGKKYTQEEAAEKLSRFLGVRWSKATFSNAERSIEGSRIKQFSADEIVAIARAFKVTISDIFAPSFLAINFRKPIINQPGLPDDRGIEEEDFYALVLGETGPPKSREEFAYALAIGFALMEYERRRPPGSDESRLSADLRRQEVERWHDFFRGFGLSPSPQRIRALARDKGRRWPFIVDALESLRSLVVGEHPSTSANSSERVRKQTATKSARKE